MAGGTACTRLTLCHPWLEGQLGASSSEAAQPGASLLAAKMLKPSCSHGASMPEVLTALEVGLSFKQYQQHTVHDDTF